jgi:hypothetical protein
MRPLISIPSFATTLNTRRFLIPIARKDRAFLTIARQFTMNRSATSARLSESSPKKYRAGKPISPETDYHLARPQRDRCGKIIWPAPKDQIQEAKDFIREWSAALTSHYANHLDEKDIVYLRGFSTNHPVVSPLVNGLSSSLIKTPMALLLEPS